MTIAELLQKRGYLVAKAREIVDTAENENRDLTQEENVSWDKIDEEIKGINTRIKRENRLQEIEASEAVYLDQGHVDQQPPKNDPRAADNYLPAFEQYVRLGANGITSDIVAVLNTSVNTEGGYLVPLEYEKKLIKALDDRNIMRSLTTPVTSATDRVIPVEADIGVATWLGENDEYTESDASFGQKNIEAHKLGRIIKISEELLADSMFDMQAYITDIFKRTFGDAEEKAFINGNGSAKPEGIMVSGQVGYTTPLNNAISTDDVIELLHSLKRPYRKNAKFILSDVVAKAIRKLKDADGQYIWRNGIDADRPDSLFGKQVIISDDVETFGADKKIMAFGDYSYYRIQDRAGISMQRLNELYAGRGQVGYRMNKRTDGKLLLPEAVKIMQMAS